MPSSVKNSEKMVKIVFVFDMLWEPYFYVRYTWLQKGKFLFTFCVVGFKHSNFQALVVARDDDFINTAS
jgi:hypothetical protein